ncbi:Uncharacterized protein BN1090_A2_03506 [Aneurinibacillus migulanus]|nr:Uncharacterized protein BN1090_A2_03506 [Aneurinibacillus migulanus]
MKSNYESFIRPSCFPLKTEKVCPSTRTWRQGKQRINTIVKSGVIKVDKERKVIPFDVLKERNTIRRKYRGYPNERLVQLLIDYHEQCNELFDSCIKSHKVLIEYRERYNRLYGLYTKSRELLKQKQERMQETIDVYFLMRSFIVKKGLEDEFRNFIWSPKKSEK